MLVLVPRIGVRSAEVGGAFFFVKCGLNRDTMRREEKGERGEGECEGMSAWSFGRYRQMGGGGGGKETKAVVWGMGTRLSGACLHFFVVVEMGTGSSVC